MGVIGLLVALILVHLCSSQNFYYKKHGYLYDIYYGPDAIQGYQKMMSPKSFKNAFSNRGERPGQCQNLNFTCTENYPYSETFNFECEHDYQCPKCFKCCHPKCFTHKVCQPIIMELTTPEGAEIITTNTTVPTTVEIKPTEFTTTSITPEIISTSSQSTSEETKSTDYHPSTTAIYTVTTERTTETTPTTKQLPSTTQMVTVSTSDQAKTERQITSMFTEDLSTKEFLTTMPVIINTTKITTDTNTTEKQTTEGILTTHHEEVTTTSPTSGTSSQTSSELTTIEKQTTEGMSTTHNEVLTTSFPVLTSTKSISTSTETSSTLYPESTITEKSHTTQKILTTTDETISTMNKSETLETTSILPITITTTTEILPSLAVAVSNRRISTLKESEDLEDTLNRTVTITTTTEIIPAQEIAASTMFPDSQRIGNNINTEPGDIGSKTSQTIPSTSVQTQETFIQESTVPELPTNIPIVTEPSITVNNTTLYSVTLSETTTARQISTISESLETLKSSLASQYTTTTELFTPVVSLEINDSYSESTSTVPSQDIQINIVSMSMELKTTTSTEQNSTTTDKIIPTNRVTTYITSEETTTTESTYSANTTQILETITPRQKWSYTTDNIDMIPIAELRSSTFSDEILKNVTKIVGEETSLVRNLSTTDKIIPTTKVTPYSTTEEDKEITTPESTYLTNSTQNNQGLETITTSQKSNSTTKDIDISPIAELRNSTLLYEALKNATETAVGETSLTLNHNIMGILLASTQSSFPFTKEKTISKPTSGSRIPAGQSTTIFDKGASTAVSTPSSNIANITDDEDLFSGSGSGDGNEDDDLLSGSGSGDGNEDDEDFFEGSGNDNVPSETSKVDEDQKVDENKNSTSFVLNIPTKKPLKVDPDQDDFDIDDSEEGRAIWTTESTEKNKLDREGVKNTTKQNDQIPSDKEVDNTAKEGRDQSRGTNSDNKQIFTKEQTTQSSPGAYTNKVSLNPVAQTIKITTEATEYQELKQVMSTTIPYNVGTTLDRSFFFPEEEEEKMVPKETTPERVIKEDSRSIESDRNVTYIIGEPTSIPEGNKNYSLTNNETADKQKEFDKEAPYDDENDEEDTLGGGSGSGDFGNSEYVEAQ